MNRNAAITLTIEAVIIKEKVTPKEFGIQFSFCNVFGYIYRPLNADLSNYKFLLRLCTNRRNDTLKGEMCYDFETSYRFKNFQLHRNYLSIVMD